MHSLNQHFQTNHCHYTLALIFSLQIRPLCTVKIITRFIKAHAPFVSKHPRRRVLFYFVFRSEKPVLLNADKLRNLVRLIIVVVPPRSFASAARRFAVWKMTESGQKDTHSDRSTLLPIFLVFHLSLGYHMLVISLQGNEFACLFRFFVFTLLGNIQMSSHFVRQQWAISARYLL